MKVLTLRITETVKNPERWVAEAIRVAQATASRSVLVVSSEREAERFASHADVVLVASEREVAA